jgi:hypothetical protein
MVCNPAGPYVRENRAYCSLTSARVGSRNTDRPPIWAARMAASSPIMVLPEDVGAVTRTFAPASSRP